MTLKQRDSDSDCQLLMLTESQEELSIELDGATVPEQVEEMRRVYAMRQEMEPPEEQVSGTTLEEQIALEEEIILEKKTPSCDDCKTTKEEQLALLEEARARLPIREGPDPMRASEAEFEDRLRTMVETPPPKKKCQAQTGAKNTEVLDGTFLRFWLQPPPDDRPFDDTGTDIEVFCLQSEDMVPGTVVQFEDLVPAFLEKADQGGDGLGGDAGQGSGFSQVPRCCRRGGRVATCGRWHCRCTAAAGQGGGGLRGDAGEGGGSSASGSGDADQGGGRPGLSGDAGQGGSGSSGSAGHGGGKRAKETNPGSEPELEEPAPKMAKK